MTSEWKGNIVLGESQVPLQSIALLRTDPIHETRLSQAARLHFLSVVYISRIPLSLVAGPPLNVGIANSESKQWFLDHLNCGTGQYNDAYGDTQWWNGSTKQSDLGILLKAQNEDNAAADASFTELLVYATAHADVAKLPTPPLSSSPDPVPGHDRPPGTIHSPPTFQLHALPLCSRILQHARKVSGLCTPPTGDDETYFIPDDVQSLEVALRKRKMSSVFEAATKQRRKSTAKGGERVAKAMATLERSQSSMHFPHRTDEQEKQSRGPAVATLSRAASDSSISLGGTVPNALPRPTTAGGRQRSSLHRVESVCGEKEGSITSETNEICEQNKAALSKIIMAGMRLHGLQSRKKPIASEARPSHSRRQSLGHDLLLGTTGEDEYKLIYHQTLKSALLAFRAHVNVKPISSDALRDVVDRLLDIFCMNPLTPPLLGGDAFESGLTTSGQEKANPFDLPSSSAPNAQDTQVMSTPMTKKRKLDDTTPQLVDPG